MASSASGQDEPNRALWLATRAGKMARTTRCIPQAKFPQKPYNKSFIDQVCSVKMAGYWPRSFFARLWTSTSSRSINTQKKNLANIQPSWTHTWSITHTYETSSPSGRRLFLVSHGKDLRMSFAGWPPALRLYPFVYWVERGTVRVKCLGTKRQHNVLSQGSDLTARSALTMRPRRLVNIARFKYTQESHKNK